MALTVTHLNTDASFLLSFEPIITNPIPGLRHEPFRILLDPWITGPSKIFHSKISISTHRHPACISSLRELPEPDLVIVSQHKSDHCNEATLRQLPPSGTKTVILAEPASARLIRSWKYFDRDKVRTLPKWEDPKLTGRQVVVRVPVPPVMSGGEPGEVTVAFISQRRDITGLHGAVGITYRPPPTSSAPLSVFSKRLQISRTASPTGLLTPPATPKSYRSFSRLPSIFTSNPFASHPSPTPPNDHKQAPPRPPRPHELHLPPGSPTTPTSPVLSLRSVRSTSSLPFSRQPTLAGSIHSNRHSHSLDRPISVLFSPHGISYASLSPYATSHLVAEAALPLTALLHCFDAVSNPWWLGGQILLGAPAGQLTAQKLCARAWISAHDGDKEVKGLATRLLRTQKWKREEVCEAVSPGRENFATTTTTTTDGDNSGGGKGGGGDGKARERYKGRGAGGIGGKSTEVLALESGEKMVLTCEGVWNVGKGEETMEMDKEKEREKEREKEKFGGYGGCGALLPPMMEVKDEGGFLNVGEVMGLR